MSAVTAYNNLSEGIHRKDRGSDQAFTNPVRAESSFDSRYPVRRFSRGTTRNCCCNSDFQVRSRSPPRTSVPLR